MVKILVDGRQPVLLSDHARQYPHPAPVQLNGPPQAISPEWHVRIPGVFRSPDGPHLTFCTSLHQWLALSLPSPNMRATIGRVKSVEANCDDNQMAAAGRSLSA